MAPLLIVQDNGVRRACFSSLPDHSLVLLGHRILDRPGQALVVQLEIAGCYVLAAPISNAFFAIYSGSRGCLLAGLLRWPQRC